MEHSGDWRTLYHCFLVPATFVHVIHAQWLYSQPHVWAPQHSEGATLPEHTAVVGTGAPRLEYPYVRKSGENRILFQILAYTEN